MILDQWLDIAWKVASAFGGALAAVAVIFWWVMRVGFVSKADNISHWSKHEKEHEDLDIRLNDGARKFTEIEGDVRHMPGSGTVEELRREIGKLGASIAGLTASDDALTHRLGHMEAQIDRLVDFHLKGGK